MTNRKPGPSLKTRILAVNAMVAALVAVIAIAPQAAEALPWAGGNQSKITLKAAIDGFKDFDTCIARLTKRLPAEISVLLDSRSLELVCRAHQAAAQSDPQVCRRSLKDYRARKKCQRFYAIYTGHSNHCPKAGYPRHREEACLALATRNPGLCRTVGPQDRPTCDGALKGESFCKKSPPGVKRLACVTAARTWRGLLKPQKASPSPSFKPVFVVRATALSSGLTLPARARHFQSLRLRHGVLVADHSGPGDWLVINSSTLFVRGVRTTTPREPILLDLQLPLLGATAIKTHPLKGGAGGSAKVTFATRTPRYRSINMTSTSGAVTISRYERKLGGRVEGSYWIILENGVEKIRIEGRFSTFVRDLVPLSGVANYMRSTMKMRKRISSRGGLSLDELRKVRARIKKITDTRYQVDPSLRDELVRDTKKLRYAASGGFRRRYSRRVSTAPLHEGYTLYTVYRRGVLWALGFRNRDVITAINKHPLRKPEDLYDAYAKLKKARRLVFAIDRGTKAIHLTLQIRRVRPKTRKAPKTHKTPRTHAHASPSP
ncbi:MAG: hypothetical protein KAI47_26355 [Deltaproteobacteria bacterium]|nr:hypothetical protein [Deltaproteobacteria bacterium]